MSSSLFVFLDVMKEQINSLDSKVLGERAITKEEITRQFDRIESGTLSPVIMGPCTLEEGIRRLDPSERTAYTQLYQEEKDALNIKRFVPASGAASRMFKALLKRTDGEKSSLANEFIEHIEEFPFWEQLKLELEKSGRQVEALNPRDHVSDVLKFLLKGSGLGFAKKPKGLIPFHHYAGTVRNAFEEHLHESTHYGLAAGEAHSHFTLAPQHIESVKSTLDKVSQELTDNSQKVSYSYSIQHPSTDTIALDSDGRIIRDEKGNILFRPGGHGALLKNLNELRADLIFVKNIDNVVPDCRKDEALSYKQPLAGLAITLSKNCKVWTDKLNTPGFNSWNELNGFIREELNVRDKEVKNEEEALTILNRPIRVCGMVKNQGEPGGGPFWVKMKDGSILPQIVEKAQIDLQKEENRDFLRDSTHFNPVDLVLITSNPNGENIDLSAYIDTDMSFIAQKSYNGKEIRALEHPGLWNGAMAYWNTVFVEVPLSTFNPVKTVNDLLRPAHRSILTES